jgi:hypothetical protein
MYSIFVLEIYVTQARAALLVQFGSLRPAGSETLNSGSGDALPGKAATDYT